MARNRNKFAGTKPSHPIRKFVLSFLGVALAAVVGLVLLGKSKDDETSQEQHSPEGSDAATEAGVARPAGR